MSYWCMRCTSIETLNTRPSNYIYPIPRIRVGYTVHAEGRYVRSQEKLKHVIIDLFIGPHGLGDIALRIKAGIKKNKVKLSTRMSNIWTKETSFKMTNNTVLLDKRFHVDVYFEVHRIGVCFNNLLVGFYQHVAPFQYIESVVIRGTNTQVDCKVYVAPYHPEQNGAVPRRNENNEPVEEHEV